MIVCLLLPSQPSKLGGGDDSFCNQLGAPKPTLIVITVLLAYGLIIFIFSDELHPKLNCLPIVKLNGQNSAHNRLVIKHYN
jgi:hypothetical protein